MSSGSRTPRSATPRSRAGWRRARARSSSTCCAPAGAPGPTATSGPTCCSPRAAWTSPANRTSRCTTWRPARSSSARPAVASPTWTAGPGRTGRAPTPRTGGCTRRSSPSCGRANRRRTTTTSSRPPAEQGAAAPSVTGLLLAAGAGQRAGGPKALRRDGAGRPWLVHAVDVLLAGGCAEVLVVLGSAGDEAQALLADHPRRGTGVRTVQNPDWADGMSTSLRAGLQAAGPSATAVLVHLVDLPDVTPEVMRRLLAVATGPGCLARAVYRGAPGHPVLIGRDHLAALRGSLAGDRGAQGYLDSRPVV